MEIRKINKFYILTFAFLLLPLFSIAQSNSEQVELIKKNIELRNAQIEILNKEIKELDNQIQVTVKEGQNLKGAIAGLDVTQNKLSKELQVTESKVNNTSLSIEQLALEINAKEKEIDLGKMALADTIRTVDQAENISIIETILTYRNASDLWNEIETLNRFQNGVRENAKALESLKSELESRKQQNESKKNELLGLKDELEDQKKIVENNKSEKSKLLSVTQSQEATYRKQLDEKKRLSEAFRKEINEYESQLNFIIDPNSYPKSGKGILSWPLENIRITQYFGDTEFSRTTNAYNGRGHNGVDFGASRGSKVMSALSGTVQGTGNTDSVPGCYSYGKWVLVKHDNGLSTLYAHLDLIKVTTGQRVSTGELVGYSGNTGYSTGPHLHFSVYASQGVRIVKYENSINCKNAVIPVADLKAYLNPLTYLQ